MQDVQNSDEELVCVLLFVAREVPGVGPHQVEQLERDVGAGHARVELAGKRERKHSEVNHNHLVLVLFQYATCVMITCNHPCSAICYSVLYWLGCQLSITFPHLRQLFFFFSKKTFSGELCCTLGLGRHLYHVCTTMAY